MRENDGESDRDLLEGVLAFQLGFARRQDFVTAVTAWLEDDSQSLGAILERREVLTGEQRELLRSLASQHLRHNGGRLPCSLAALESAFSLRGELRRLRRARVEGATVQAIMAPATMEPGVLNSLLSESEYAQGDAPAGGAYGEPSAESCSEGESNPSRFRILQALAEGSLGSVFVAQDTVLHREVAVKAMKPQFADDPASRSRFALEAEVTQALEHPGIAPVYGVGHHADGRPFYAMRLVKGASLKQAIAAFHGQTPGEKPGGPRRKLASRDFYRIEFRKLLGRLVHVCHTIEFAHQRGVLHRDIKPSNIMIGDHGDTVVVDWGLAKVAGKPEVWQADGDLAEPLFSGSGSMTHVGAVIGTPAYMSPEQAAGGRETLVAATDVYGIGATLYHLLTGQAPLAKQPLREMLSRVQRGDISPVRSLNPAVPRSIAAICHKAMAVDPRQRYASAAALGEDLERWLADEPITAYSDGQWVQSARWVRHNMATYTLSLIVFLSIFIVGLAARCRQLELANELLRLEAAAEDSVPAHPNGLGATVATADVESPSASGTEER